MICCQHVYTVYNFSLYCLLKYTKIFAEISYVLYELSNALKLQFILHFKRKSKFLLNAFIFLQNGTFSIFPYGA